MTKPKKKHWDEDAPKRLDEDEPTNDTPGVIIDPVTGLPVRDGDYTIGSDPGDVPLF